MGAPQSPGYTILFLDEENRVGAFDSSRHALGEASNFVAVGALPQLAVFGIADEVAVLHEFACLLIQDCCTYFLGETSRHEGLSGHCLLAYVTTR